MGPATDRAPGGTLAVDGVRKAFGRDAQGQPRWAVDGLALAVGPGEICGLLGPNGAGKTTSLRMMATLLAPDAGRIAVCGVDTAADPLAARRHLGHVPAEAGLPPRMRPREVVALFAELHGLPRPGAAATAQLTELGAAGWADTPCGELSTGMKRRVVLARALVHRPRVLLLDEPTDGLDVGGRQEVLALLRGLARDRGCAVLLSSHIMSEVAAVADHYVVLARGRTRARGTEADLRAQAGAPTLDAAFLQLVADAP